MLSNIFHWEGYIFEESEGFFDGCTACDSYPLEKDGEGIDGTISMMLPYLE